MTMINDYMNQLNKLDRQLNALGFCQNLVFWDAATLAPKNAVTPRGTALAEVSELYYNLFITPETDTLLNSLEASKESLTKDEQIKVDFFRELYDQTACIPVGEYAAFSKLKTESSAAWENAKASGDFSTFEPYLQQVIDFQRKYIHYRDLGGHPYNTLLNDYEKGLTVETADLFFDQLRQTIVPLLKKITEKNKQTPAFFTDATYSIDGQKAFSQLILDKMNFNLESGIIAESVHPFTLNMDPNDVRITTTYQEDYALSSIYSTIHECGHGLYEQNISEDIGFSKLATGTSMGIHESQSRIYENNVGRSLAFWQAYFEDLRQFFPEQLKEATPKACYEASNNVKASLIRIEADELTYSLHIMIRYELEKAIFEGVLEAKDLPEAWNKKYHDYLGLTPSNDAEGVLQDVHWSEGLFGYFPSYALGSAYACQFEAAMNKEFSVKEAITSDNLDQINQWLKEHIHRFGCMKTPDEIIQYATNEPFNPQYFLDYLVEKYSDLYAL